MLYCFINVSEKLLGLLIRFMQLDTFLHKFAFVRIHYVCNYIHDKSENLSLSEETCSLICYMKMYFCKFWLK